jgi:hypothetical protein
MATIVNSPTNSSNQKHDPSQGMVGGHTDDLFKLSVDTFDQNNKKEQYVGVDERTAKCRVGISANSAAPRWNGTGVMQAYNIRLWVNVMNLPDRVVVVAPDGRVGWNKYPDIDGWFPIPVASTLQNMPGEIAEAFVDIRTGLFASLAMQSATSKFSFDKSNVDLPHNSAADPKTGIKLELRVTCQLRKIIADEPPVCQDWLNRPIVFDIVD